MSNAKAIRELQRFNLRLDGLNKELANLNLDPLCDRLAKMLDDYTEYMFEMEKDPDGDYWEPTMAAIKAHRKTLQDTQAMRRSIYFYSLGNTVTGVSPEPYSYSIQYGYMGMGGDKKMPERIFMEWGKNNTDLVCNAAEAYVDEVVSKYFGGGSAWKPRTYFSQVI